MGPNSPGPVLARAELRLALLELERLSLPERTEGISNVLINNAAERALRTPVIGRKNFYGSGAAWVADLAADIWTITATAAQNDIEPLHLLADYLASCARNDGKPLTGDQLAPFLPRRVVSRDVKPGLVGRG